MQAVLKAQINKTDRNDARGIAQMMRVGLYRRSSSKHAAVEEMVLAQGLGDADRQAPRDKEGDRGAGTPVSRDQAPHLG